MTTDSVFDERQNGRVPRRSEPASRGQHLHFVGANRDYRKDLARLVVDSQGQSPWIRLASRVQSSVFHTPCGHRTTIRGQKSIFLSAGTGAESGFAGLGTLPDRGKRSGGFKRGAVGSGGGKLRLTTP